MIIVKGLDSFRMATHNKAIVRMQTTLRFVCTGQYGRSRSEGTERTRV